MIRELCGDRKIPQDQDARCSLPRHNKTEEDATPGLVSHVQTNMFVNVWARRTPFAPKPYCCLGSHWLRRVWKSTSVELQGGRPLVLAFPTLPLWFLSQV